MTRPVAERTRPAAGVHPEGLDLEHRDHAGAESEPLGTALKVDKVDIRAFLPATVKLQVENGDVDIALNLTPDLAIPCDNKNVKSSPDSPGRHHLG
jgi:predicted metal-dependent HD superfamily phosphohydrolase